MSDIVEGTAIEETGVELVSRDAATTLIKAESAASFIAQATDIAQALSSVIRSQGLVTVIQGREHVQVEAWTLCGSILGVFPVVEWTHKTDDGWEARVVAKTLSGATVGAAESMCSRSERTWKSRDDYAIRSMAQTRAVSKAMRAPLGFIMSLAGFVPTPVEEMEGHDPTPTAGGSNQQTTFNPAVDLLPGAPSGQKFLQDGMKMLAAKDATVEWPAVVTQAILGCYGAEKAKDIPKEFFPEFACRYANVCAAIHDGREPVDAFAWAFNGTVVELARVKTDDLPDFGGDS